MRNNMVKYTGIAVLVAIVVTAAMSSAAFAERPPVGPGNGPQAGPDGRIPFGPIAQFLDGNRRPAVGFGRGDLVMSKDDVEAAIAGALGMTVDELDAAVQDQTLAEIAKDKNVHMADVEAAVDTARQDALQKLVADGTLTQEQAELIASKVGEGVFGKDNTGLMFGAERLKESLAMSVTVAGTLGMTVEELNAALEEKTLLELAKDQNVALADIQAALQDARKAELDKALEQAVADGKLTEEEADTMSAMAALRGDKAGGFPGIGMQRFPMGRPGMKEFNPRSMFGGRMGRSDNMRGYYPGGMMSDRGIDPMLQDLAGGPPN